MSDFTHLIELTGSKDGGLLEEFRTLLGKEFTLGMSRYVCRYGTLSESFEKLTDSQKFYQATKEAYVRVCEMKRMHSRAKKSYADFLDAKVALEKATTESERLRAEANLEDAELSAYELLMSAKDTERQLDEFLKIRSELANKVRTKYPEGLEQAEPDDWRRVGEYRILRQSVTKSDTDARSVPLSQESKQDLALIFNRKDLLAEKAVTDPEGFNKLMEIRGLPNEL